MQLEVCTLICFLPFFPQLCEVMELLLKTLRLTDRAFPRVPGWEHRAGAAPELPDP